MGLFTFIKSAGAAIFGKGKPSKEEAAAVEAKEEAKERLAERHLHGLIRELGFEIEHLTLKIEDDMAMVGGEAANQETKEKIVLLIGNSEGIASVQDNMTVEVQEPEATFHTVVSGDTLSKIAKQVYGNAMKYPVIFEANKPMLTDPDKIYPGQVLRIPKL
ncbi:MAG: peptidoglycan-binding protein LysM [Gilvibacter sp.]